MRWCLSLAILLAPITGRVLFAADTGFVPSESSPYRCDDVTGRCSCYGIVSCEHLRSSGVCRGPLACDADTCRCDSGAGSGRRRGKKGEPGAKPPSGEVPQRPEAPAPPPDQ